MRIPRPYCRLAGRVRRPTTALLGLAALVSTGLIAGCAASYGTREAVRLPLIPAEMGELRLEAPGIALLNYRIVDAATQREVVVERGRGRRAMSVRAVERGTETPNLSKFVPPGTYSVSVETDLEQEDDIEIDDVEVRLGEITSVPVPVGQFDLIVVSSDASGSGPGSQVQFPFKIWDYTRRSLLGTGMTSTQVKHFVAREGLYKLSLEPDPGSGGELIAEVRVQAGRVFPVRIEIPGIGPASSPQTPGAVSPGE